MPITKLTVSVSGDTPDEIEALAVAEANKYFADLPGNYRATEVDVTSDPDWYESRVTSALKAAESKFEELPEDEREGIEVVPERVARYDATLVFEYDPNQAPAKKSIGDVWAESGTVVQEPAETAPRNPANDPRYQAPYEEAQL